MSNACRESLLVISDIVNVENECTNFRATHHDRYGRHLYTQSQLAYIPCPLSNTHISLHIETDPNIPRLLKSSKDMTNMGNVCLGSACVNCSCPCMCCTKVSIEIDIARLEIYAEMYQTKYISTLLAETTDKPGCESYFTTNSAVYDREDGLCWRLLSDRKCKNRYCTCICECCLQEPFKMTLSERIAFEHWLDLAHEVDIYDRYEYTSNVGNVNPLRFVAGNIFNETDLDRGNEVDDDLADMMEYL